ncbi:MAG: urease accessory protein UreE [Hyphomicrobiales bacterium]
MALRAIKHIPLSIAPGTAFDGFTLEAQDRHLRRKLLVTDDGLEVLVDLPQPVFAGDGDHLELEDGRFVEVLAAEEDLYEIRGVSPRHVVTLAWQLGNRHLPAQLEWDRILIRRDPVIRTMLEKLHASVTEVREQFFPEQGAYAAHGPFGHGH